jgi:DNA replication and repair protein RecF
VSLRVTSLDLTDFRSYERFTLQLDDRVTVLTGPNGAGKTNAVEALQMLTAGVSFRNPQWGELVRWGASKASAVMEASGDGRRLNVSLEITAEGRRSYRVNGTSRRKMSEVTGILPSVLFTPDDLRVVKDSADRRRETLDRLGDQLSPAYASIRAEYDKTLRQRNALLKEEVVPEATMDAWTERLVELGASLALHRMRLFERMAPAAAGIYAVLSGGEELSISYHSSIAGELATSSEEKQELITLFGMKLAEKRSEERARRNTVVGPHRDDVVFSIEGRDARAFGSQGQQRSVSLSWKLAEVHAVEEVTGSEPLLLLDDVMSELDQARRHALASFVGERAQTVITTANLGYFSDELIRDAKVVEIG